MEDSEVTLLKLEQLYVEPGLLYMAMPTSNSRRLNAVVYDFKEISCT